MRTVIDFSATAENVFLLGTMVCLGSTAASYALSPLNLQGLAIVFLRDNGKFQVVDRNTLKHICSLQNSQWGAVMQSF